MIKNNVLQPRLFPDDRHRIWPLPLEERPSALQCANNDHSSPTGQKRVKFSASDGELGRDEVEGWGEGGRSCKRTRHPQLGVAEVCSLCCNAAQQGSKQVKVWGALGGRFQSVTLLLAVYFQRLAGVAGVCGKNNGIKWNSSQPPSV